NQRSNPELRASDYLELEGLMSILNEGKVLSRAVDLCDDSIVGQAFREILGAKERKFIKHFQNESSQYAVLPL
ncbi:MAG TPA: hypothetical protein VEP90_17180, partial [Methylomirabilota bacterium]|nr:hypothetical protein [Methylomirabilota bacterium]